MVRFSFLLLAVLSLVLRATTEGADTWTGWPFFTFHTADSQPPRLDIGNVGDNVDPGLIFMSVRNSNEDLGTAPTIYDNNGDMVWQGPNEKTMNFRQQRLHGRDVITFWDGETGVLGYGYGSVHILDTSYRELYRITLEDDDLVTPTGALRESYIDVHEHIITPRNTIIVSAINITQADLTAVPDGGNDMWVIVPLFYEIDIPTNQVLFKWDAQEHMDEIPLSKSKQRFWGGDVQSRAWDGYHMNSVHPMKDGYLVSIRFLWGVYYVSNKDGSVLWALTGDEDEGDFELNDFRFSWQHDARAYHESDTSVLITLFNNAATRSDEDGESTALAVNLDLENMTASPLYNLVDPADPLISRTQGSFQFIDEPDASHMFVGYGSTPLIKEYDQDGNVVFTAQYGGRHAQCYRAFKFPWHATPYWDPEIVVEHRDNSTTDVYMSWNGATDYDNWALFSVPSVDSSVEDGIMLATQERTGFESLITLQDADAEYIVADARRGEQVLRSSPIVPLRP